MTWPSRRKCIHEMLQSAPQKRLLCPMCRAVLGRKDLHDAVTEEEAAAEAAKRRAQRQIACDYGTKVGPRPRPRPMD